MLSAPGKRAGLLIAGLVALVALGFAPLYATDGIDAVTTGSVSQTAEASTATVSAAYKAAIGLVTSGDYAEASDAARNIPSDLERRTV